MRFGDSKFNPKFQTEVVRGSTDSGLARHQHIGFTIDLTFIADKEMPIIEDVPIEEPVEEPVEEPTEEPVELGVILLYEDAYPDMDANRPFRRFREELYYDEHYGG